MSYDIELKHPVSGKVILLGLPHHMTGGTYALGGTREACLNVTYNYAPHYAMSFDDKNGIRSIYGLTGAESIPVLQLAISRLGNDMDDNYWNPTEGNAKAALLQLLALAQMRPDGVWDGD